MKYLNKIKDWKEMVNEVVCGDCLEGLKKLPDNSIDMVITSPPYWALRDYGVEGQLGLEPTFEEYIDKLCTIFDEVKRVLKKEGTCWVNLGDTYSMTSVRGGDKPFGDGVGANKHYEKGSISFKREKQTIQPKSLIQIPSHFAIEMCNRGWILRNEIIWHKPSCMPSSATDRFTVDFEKIFFFTKSKKYYFEQQKEPQQPSESSLQRYKSTPRKERKNTEPMVKDFPHENFILSQGRNKRCVWSINTKSYKDAHFATYPPKLIETPIKAGCPEGGIVLDIFMGSGTTGRVAKDLGRNFIGLELNPEYCKLADKRLAQQNLF